MTIVLTATATFRYSTRFKHPTASQAKINLIARARSQKLLPELKKQRKRLRKADAAENANGPIASGSLNEPAEPSGGNATVPAISGAVDDEGSLGEASSE